jgi:hypothetical protein
MVAALSLGSGCLGGGRAQSGKAGAKLEAAQAELQHAMSDCALGKKPTVRSIEVVVALEESGRPFRTELRGVGGELEPALERCLVERIEQIEFPRPADRGETRDFVLTYD